MTQDIKATVEELVTKWGDASKDCEEADAFVDQLVTAWPSLLAELRRLWVIEEAAVRYREAYEDWDANESMANDCMLGADQHEARDVLFAALPPRKPSGGEEAR